MPMLTVAHLTEPNSNNSAELKVTAELKSQTATTQNEFISIFNYTYVQLNILVTKRMRVEYLEATSNYDGLGHVCRPAL